MKVLVADDDGLVRRLLLTLLTKLGHEVQMAENGHEAWTALDVSNPPALVIMDWVMPGLNGVDVCRKLRANPGRNRPYVLLLSAKSEKQEVITGLDAGADDYLVKPFDPMSMLARLRVAQRIIAYQDELQRNIANMEVLLHRHNLLGEMYGKQHRQPEAPDLASASTPSAIPLVEVTVETPSGPAAKPVKAVISPERLTQYLSSSFAEAGLKPAYVVAGEARRALDGETFTAWAPVVLLKQGWWMDMLLEAEEQSAVAMFESLLGRIPVSERELLDFLAETFNLICNSIKAALNVSGMSCLAPIISRATRTSSLTIQPPTLSAVTHHQIALRGGKVNFTVVSQPSPTRQKSFGSLNPFDILAENLPSPTAKGVFLLNQGIVLNERYIEKLSSLAGTSTEAVRVPIVEPSRYAQFFCLGRIAG